MATSGSVNFNLTRDQVIASAFENVGVGVEGEALSAHDVGVASRMLNVLIKAHQPHGLQLWKRDELTVTLVASQATYTIGRSGTPSLTADRPLRVLMAELEDSSGYGSELTWVSRDGMFDLPTSTGNPNQYNYDPTLNNGTLRIWPTPDTTAASTYTIKLLVQSPIEDMDNSTDDFDFPQEWYDYIILALSYRLSFKYPIPLQEKYILRKDVKDALDLVLGGDVEDSVQFQMDNQ